MNKQYVNGFIAGLTTASILAVITFNLVVKLLWQSTL